MPNKEMSNYLWILLSLTILLPPDVIEMLVISRHAACYINLVCIFILAINLSFLSVEGAKEHAGGRPYEATEGIPKHNSVPALPHWCHRQPSEEVTAEPLLSLVLGSGALLPRARLMASVRTGPFGLKESLYLLHTSYCIVNNSFLASKKQTEA